MDRLTEEEVLHVAELARIQVDADEILKYSVELKKLLDDIDKIKDVTCSTEDLLVTPVHHTVSLRKDSDARRVDFDEFKKNMPKTVGKFVEVAVNNHE